MASISRLYVFYQDKFDPTKVEVEFGNIVNTWNNHEQGIARHTIVWTQQLWISPTIVTVAVAGAYNALATDCVIVINQTSGAAIQVNLSTTLNTGRIVVIKDGKGDAGANNITISGNGGNIDGAATLVLSTNYKAVQLLYNGTQWNVISAS